MRAACKLAAQVLDFAGTLVQPGTTTDQIDKAVHKMIIDNGAYPSPLNYGRFPKSVCTSVNECVCHGIPDDRPLQEGDIINIDVTVYLDGYHGDTSRMFFAGTPSPEARRLCEVTQMALNEAIQLCGPGVPYNKIGKAIHHIADNHYYGVIKEYVGHGVGRRFHSAPTINHTRNNLPGNMQLWQTFTIEPMLVQGQPKCDTWKDEWTVVTRDGGLAAQYEHTVLITPGGVEILTLP
uniref:Methionine aminopeptidase n=2 Tax=Dunaliella tertiolecta TaxID=3047 RepID=A0A7S3QMP3_DUNTE